MHYSGASVQNLRTVPLMPGTTFSLGDAAAACKDAEAAMVQNAATVTLKADVLIAPNHGADNGSSQCFIQAVDPTFVIFSAGAQHRHPRAATAQRYLSHGVPLANIFRTDRGDDEGADEWDHGRVPGCKSPTGYDHIEILLPRSGAPAVAWIEPQHGC